MCSQLVSLSPCITLLVIFVGVYMTIIFLPKLSPYWDQRLRSGDSEAKIIITIPSFILGILIYWLLHLCVS